MIPVYLLPWAVVWSTSSLSTAPGPDSRPTIVFYDDEYPSGSIGANAELFQRREYLRINEDRTNVLRHGIGPQGPVFGDGGNARLIVFVCNINPIPGCKASNLKDELNKAIVSLKPIQSFNVIFADGEKPAAFVDVALCTATPASKRKVATFLEDVKLSPKVDPIPAIELAMKSNPDLVYLLTNTDFPNNDAVVKHVAELNKIGKIKVNTVYWRENSDTPAVVDVLKRIAKENRGTFRDVKPDDL